MRPIQRVALVYDDRPRPETTGVYCRRALAEWVEVTHFLPEQLESIPPDEFDLFLNIDDGMRYDWPAKLAPAACWIIDTHLDFQWSLNKAKQFEFVFAAQKRGAEELVQHGVASATWLALACDPDIHRPHALEKRYDVAFVGNLFPGPRSDLTRLIQERYPDSFVGQRYFEEMARTYSEARIVFNRSLKDDLNMRVFEALGCGACLLTNRLEASGQADLFEEGVHLASYAERDELLDKLKFYLARDDLRQRIGQAARHLAIEQHTYRHRLQTILETVSQKQPRHSGSATAPANDRPEKSTSYYDFARPELLAKVPTTARNVLELGCGRGRLGESIKARQAARVIGIELDPEAATVARTRLDRVYVGDVESEQFSIEETHFDCILCGDVLEHLTNPLALLRRFGRQLSTDGTLIASIPNVQYHQVVAGLLEGNWTYEPAGILDDTHRHFFTRLTIEQLFFRAGLRIEQLGAVPGPGDTLPTPAQLADGLRLGRIHLTGITAEQAQGFFAYQYLIIARPVITREFPLTSIVVVTHNELAYTKACLESVRELTDEPYELIVVDNGSTDGTPEYLAGCSDVRLIAHAENRGFPVAVNQGLKQAAGSQIVLLNNDVVVTTGWLRRLLIALEQSPDIGLVGPMTNCTSGLQRIEPPYRHLDELEQFAWEWAAAHAGQCQPVEVLMGFCLAFRRELVKRLGDLDERFELGVYEDVDFCRRATRAGYRNLIALDAYVHHFGHRTFIGQGIDADGWLARNERVFAEKWQTGSERSLDLPQREAYRTDPILVGVPAT